MKKGRILKKSTSFLLVLTLLTSTLFISSSFAQSTSKTTDELWSNFQSTPTELKSRPLWFWNDSMKNMSKEGITEMMTKSKEESGYYGFGILPNWMDGYLSDEYFELYGHALKTAKELGLKMCLYDENGFPSGSANDGHNGGLFEKNHPESTYKRLDKNEIDIVGPARAIVNIPQGEYSTYMGAVMMNNDTKEIVDISKSAIFVDDSDPDNLIGARSSSYHSVGYDATKAFDGDMSSRWNAADRAIEDEWLRINYGSDITVDKIIIRENLDRITSYSLQYLKGAQWTNIETGTTIGTSKEFSFAAITASSFRLVIHDLRERGGASIYEFELYNDGIKIPNPIDQVSHVEHDVPAGNWKVMAFATVKDGRNLVDYLSEEAVDKFIDMTHEEYYKRFPEYFGDVIDSSFYDEPPLYHASGRTWTGEFNTMFEDKYNFNPIIYYPSLWYDAGPNTEAMRNSLFNFKADLFAENYIKNLNDWCEDKGIILTGHMDQEEVVNPVPISGDLLKVFKHQAMPGLDSVFAYDRGRVMYKVVSSSAYNYDKPNVMSEIYGGMGEGMGIPVLYKDAMDQSARGVNYFVPHAIWYNNRAGVENPPELSYRSAQYGKELPIYNNFISRMATLMQGGRHVADIGVLYPINTLEAGYRFGPENQYEGGLTAVEADYLSVGDLLSTTIRRDFTFLHPEVIAENTSVVGNELRLDNEINFENYKVFIMPGSKTISYEALKQIKAFYDAGGKVISTTQLPYKSAEFGHDEDVVKIIDEMFESVKITYKASSIFSDGYAADKAFDSIASESSRWNAGDLSGGDQWLEVDFGEEIAVNRIVAKESSPYRVTNYRVQYWNGRDWIDAASGTNIGTSAEKTFDEVTTNKVRLYIDTITSDSVSITEFEVYHDDSENLAMPMNDFTVRTNDNGGMALSLGKGYMASLEDALDYALGVYDVELDSSIKTSGGHLSYIHKVKDNNDVYYFANSSDNAISTYVDIRASFENPMIWDPHTGDKYAVEFSSKIENGTTVTNIKLDIPAVRSVFIIDEKTGSTSTLSAITTNQKLVEGYAANLNVKVSGENIDNKSVWVYIDIDGEKIGLTKTANNKATIKIPKNNDFVNGTYKAVAYIEGLEDFAVETNIEVVKDNPNIWKINLSSDDDMLVLNFNADITHSSAGFVVTVNGKEKAFETIGSRAIKLSSTKVDDLSNGDTIVVSNVVFEDLFPSYRYNFKKTFNSFDVK